MRTVPDLVNCRAPSRGRRKAERSISRQPSAKNAIDAPLAWFVVYRSAVLSADTQAIVAFEHALRERGLPALILAVPSLKDEAGTRLLRQALALRRPDIVVTTTAFSAREDESFVLDQADCPVLQIIAASSTREAWRASARGLSASDMTMQIVLPEFDGRIAIGPIAFKEEAMPDPLLGYTGRRQSPVSGRHRARRRSGSRVGRTSPQAPRRAPARDDPLGLSSARRTGGVCGRARHTRERCGIVDCLAEAGYDAARTFDAAGLMSALTGAAKPFAVPLPRYKAWLNTLPEAQRTTIDNAWGPPESDPALVNGAFRFAALRAGNVLVALQPDRGRAADRKAFYHDPDAPPTHAYLAFYLGLREIECIDALIHLGTHGTTEWLPGKAVALSGECAPRLAIGSLPVIYPFIVDDPGEAAPASGD